MGQVASLSSGADSNASSSPIILQDPTKFNFLSISITKPDNLSDNSTIPNEIRITNTQSGQIQVAAFCNSVQTQSQQQSEGKTPAACHYVQNLHLLEFQYPFLIQLLRGSWFDFTVESDGKYIDEITSRNRQLAQSRQRLKKQRHNNFHQNHEQNYGFQKPPALEEEGVFDSESDEEDKFNDANEYSSIHKASYLADDGELLEEKKSEFLAKKSKEEQVDDDEDDDFNFEASRGLGFDEEYENLVLEKNTQSVNDDSAYVYTSSGINGQDLSRECSDSGSEEEDDDGNILFKSLCLVRGKTNADIQRKLQLISSHYSNPSDTRIENLVYSDSDIDIIGDVYNDEDEQEDKMQPGGVKKTPKFRFSFDHAVPEDESQGDYIYVLYYQDSVPSTVFPVSASSGPSTTVPPALKTLASVNSVSSYTVGKFEPLMRFAVSFVQQRPAQAHRPPHNANHSYRSNRAHHDETHEADFSTSSLLESLRPGLALGSKLRKKQSVDDYANVTASSVKQQSKIPFLAKRLLKKLSLTSFEASSVNSSTPANMSATFSSARCKVSLQNGQQSKLLMSMGEGYGGGITLPIDTTATIRNRDEDAKGAHQFGTSVPVSKEKSASNVSLQRSKKESWLGQRGNDSFNSPFNGSVEDSTFLNNSTLEGGQTNNMANSTMAEVAVLENDVKRTNTLRSVRSNKSSRSLKSLASAKSLTKSGKKAFKKLKKTFSGMRSRSKISVKDAQEGGDEEDRDDVATTTTVESDFGDAHFDGFSGVNVGQQEEYRGDVNEGPLEEQPASGTMNAEQKAETLNNWNNETYFMASNDGPVFRETLKDMETYLINLRPVLKNYFKRTDSYVESVVLANLMRKHYIEALSSLKKFLISNNPHYDRELNDSISEILERLNQETEYYDNYNSLLMKHFSLKDKGSKDTGVLVMANGDEYLDTLFKNFNALKKSYSEKNKDYYNWLNKYLANDRSLISKLPLIGSSTGVSSSSDLKDINDEKDLAAMATNGEDGDAYDEAIMISNSVAGIGDTSSKRRSFTSKRSSFGGGNDTKIQVLASNNATVANATSSLHTASSQTVPVVSSTTDNKDVKFVKKKRSFELERFDYFNYLNDYRNGDFTEQLKGNMLRFLNELDLLTIDNKNKISARINQQTIKQLDEKICQVNHSWLKYKQVKTVQRSAIASATSNDDLVRALQVPSALTNGKTASSEAHHSIISSTDGRNNYAQGGSGAGTSGDSRLEGAVTAPGDTEHPVHEGILWTYGGGNRHGWHKQWVVLRDGYLREYLDWKSGKQLRGAALDIRFGCIRPSASASDRRFCFEVITTTGVRRLFQAASGQDREQWLAVLNQSVGLLVHSNHLEQLLRENRGSSAPLISGIVASAVSSTSHPANTRTVSISSSASGFSLKKNFPISTRNPPASTTSSINNINSTASNSPSTTSAGMFGRNSRSFKKSGTAHLINDGAHNNNVQANTDHSASSTRHYAGNSNSNSNDANNSSTTGNSAYPGNYNSMSVNQINTSYAAATSQSGGSSSNNNSELNYLDIVRNSHQSNVYCADCGSTKSVDWISISLLVVVCIDCSGVHRSLGSHLSKIRSLTLDISIFTSEIVKLLHSVNNRRTNSYWEHRLQGSKGELIHPHSSATERSSFIISKYKEKRYIEEDLKVNSHLIYGIHSNDIHMILKSLACGGNPNMVVIKGKEKEIESSLLEYALTHYSGPASHPVFEIAELLLLNGANCGTQVTDNLNLIEPAKRFWQAKIDRSLGISLNSITSPGASANSNGLGNLPAGSNGYFYGPQASGHYQNGSNSVSPFLHGRDESIDSHITNGISSKKDKKKKNSGMPLGAHGYNYSDAGEIQGIGGGNTIVTRAGSGTGTTKKNFHSQIPLFSFSRSSKKKH